MFGCQWPIISLYKFLSVSRPIQCALLTFLPALVCLTVSSLRKELYLTWVWLPELAHNRSLWNALWMNVTPSMLREHYGEKKWQKIENVLKLWSTISAFSDQCWYQSYLIDNNVHEFMNSLWYLLILLIWKLSLNGYYVLAWRIPGTGKPGGLPSMGSHRVGHNWSDLAAAAASFLFLRAWGGRN